MSESNSITDLSQQLSELSDLCERISIGLFSMNVEQSTYTAPLWRMISLDCKAVDLLLKAQLLSQAYMVGRSILEKVVNIGYLYASDKSELDNFVDYSKNKGVRKYDRKIIVKGKVRLKLEDGWHESLPDELQDAVSKFTSVNGREVPRWTKSSIDARSKVVEQKYNVSLSPYLSYLYEDASEALHGTLYGCMFELGVYDIYSAPTKNKELLDHDVERQCIQFYGITNLLLLNLQILLEEALFCHESDSGLTREQRKQKTVLKKFMHKKNLTLKKRIKDLVRSSVLNDQT